jgi:long-chain acyl-CoA synthetase
MTSFEAMTTSTKGICKLLKVTSDDRYLSYLPVCKFILHFGGFFHLGRLSVSHDALFRSFYLFLSFFGSILTLIIISLITIPAHGMERWLGECVPLYTGEVIYFAESLTTFVTDLNRCRPTLFLSVPRLWTKFQAGVFTKMPEKKLSMLLKIPLINILIRKKILKGLGLDKVRIAGSGSAPIPAQTLTWYRTLGLDLQEGYGMTENFNYSHMSLSGRSRAGYVGETYDDCECRIAEDGEIQVKTPGMMMGYYKNEESTKETITDDGFVRTGDKGEIDEMGRLKITGRTKEIFKSSKGKYIAPAPIENEFIRNHLIDLACVSGRGQPQPHAIIQLAEGPKAKALEGAEAREKMTTELTAHLNAVNPGLEAHEKLSFLVIVKDDWLPENGFLTPTQKIKRSTIEDAYASDVEGWYSQKQKVIWHGF